MLLPVNNQSPQYPAEVKRGTVRRVETITSATKQVPNTDGYGEGRGQS